MGKKQIARVWVDDHAVCAETTDGLRASYEFAQWPRLRNATDAQRRDFYLSYHGIHWSSLDEDLCFEGMFHDAGLCDITPTEDSVYYSAPYGIDDDAPLPTAAEEPAGYGK
ncbi:MAG: DUF2442 domain-containing protein [Bacteroidales bacterium]|nr:DUF2442 domain-containing protein [Bacteroidales bacterium]